MGTRNSRLTRLFALRNVETFVRNPNNNIRVNLDFNYEIDPNTIGANVRFETVDGQLQPYSLTTKKSHEILPPRSNSPRMHLQEENSVFTSSLSSPVLIVEVP